jgi:hypothetical protein
MVTLESKQGRPYEIDGKYIVWHPEVWEDEDPLPDVRLPLRMKMGVLLDIGENVASSTNEKMRETLLAIVPSAVDVLDQMDVNDFQDMFMTWMDVYSGRAGLNLGEALPLPDSLPSNGAKSNTTSVRASGSRSHK